MEYTIIVNNQSYDLPKKTLDVVTRLDEVLKVDANNNLNVRQKFEKLHGFIKGLVGEEQAKEMFGSDNLTEIDLTELTLAVKKVIEAYEKPVADYDMEQRMQKIYELPLDKISTISKAAENLMSVPGVEK